MSKLGTTEICLLATRGKPRVKDHSINQIIVAPRREHSRKPDEQYPRIMRLCEGPYLELFARARWPGWKVWGLEAPGAATLDEVSEPSVTDNRRTSVTDNQTTCVICGGAFIARHGAKTCSAKCRQSAYRRRVTDERNIPTALSLTGNPTGKPLFACSACRNLAASYHHCLVRKDIRIANSDNPIECDSYRPR